LQKIIEFKKPKKTHLVPSDKKILIFRHSRIRYYPYPRRGKILPVCS